MMNLIIALNWQPQSKLFFSFFIVNFTLRSRVSKLVMQNKANQHLQDF